MGFPLEKFERAVVFRCLHLQAKPLWWLLWLNRDYYAADFDFVGGVGSLRSQRDFRTEVSEFHYHPRNRGLLRSGLQLRVSAKKVQKLFEKYVQNPHSTAPMPH
ncbi:MAG: hypothetical protein NVV74_10735 [Magnetospirillum sp.]|nr:hypothetical protein [Magnetospirillum sp.]